MVISWSRANSLADRSFLIGVLECVFQNIFLAIKIYPQSLGLINK